MNFPRWVCLLSISVTTGALGQTPAPAPSPTTPGLESPDKTAAPLVVNRFWYPKDTTKRLVLSTGALARASDGVWVAGNLEGRPTLGALYHVNLDSFQATAVTSIQTANPQDMLITDEAVYLIYFAGSNPQEATVERYDFALKDWDEHKVLGVHSYPVSDTIYEVAGRFYMGLKSSEGESAIARYDPKTGELTLLASSRRRPGQNQFDDRTPFLVSSIFAGPQGKPCVMILDMQNIRASGSYYINEQPGPWPPLTSFGILFHTQTDGIRTLLYGRGSRSKNPDMAVMIDPLKDEPELWLGNPSLGSKTIPSPQMAPPMQLPAWGLKPVWPMADDNDTDDYGFRGNDLFALTYHNQTTELIWYRRGNAEPTHIPLSFELDQPTDTALNAFLDKDTVQRIEGSGKTTNLVGCAWTTAPQGICISPMGEQGFWYLPFTDIDAYMKANEPDQSMPVKK